MLNHTPTWAEYASTVSPWKNYRYLVLFAPRDGDSQKLTADGKVESIVVSLPALRKTLNGAKRAYRLKLESRNDHHAFVIYDTQERLVLADAMREVLEDITEDSHGPQCSYRNKGECDCLKADAHAMLEAISPTCNYNPATREVYLNGNYAGDFDGNNFVPGKDLLAMDASAHRLVDNFVATLVRWRSFREGQPCRV